MRNGGGIIGDIVLNLAGCTEENHENFRQDIQCLGRDFNRLSGTLYEDT
jgi:hypothetical protein